MSFPKPLSWLKTRPHYVKYMQAKKAHKKALKEFNASRDAIISVAKQYLKSTMTSSIEVLIDAIVENFFVENLHEMSDTLKINIKHIETLPVRFIKARTRYAKAVIALNETYEAAEAAETAYNNAVFQALRIDYNFPVQHIADLFGMWITSIRNRLDSNKDSEDV